MSGEWIFNKRKAIIFVAISGLASGVFTLMSQARSSAATLAWNEFVYDQITLTEASVTLAVNKDHDSAESRDQALKQVQRSYAQAKEKAARTSGFYAGSLLCLVAVMLGQLWREDIETSDKSRTKLAATAAIILLASGVGVGFWAFF